MKFGYFCNTTNWDHKPYNQLLDETKEITTYCDENNWDSIWYTEHHFNHEGMESCTNPLMMGVDAAARTKQIRIGQACNVITFHNPIRLAEDIALLDQLSGGRVDVGIGRGIYGREAINMNKEADLKDQAKNFRLFEESLKQLNYALDDDPKNAQVHKLRALLFEALEKKEKAIKAWNDCIRYSKDQSMIQEAKIHLNHLNGI